ncbi:hypothetical protein [Enterobacter hormaechei]|uniref:hypothetical protein n=1 Tax=Enterobacter hormaechei TaxID=158836 RepID=UPI002074F6EE|nr:hypothetical protein [unidentified bacterial endosymbiont]MCM7196451.1 hypothetical protein [Enterobacter hormaechei]
MNLPALHYLVENATDLLIDSANQTHRSPDAVVGIARQVDAEQTINNLSEAQLYNFNIAILPLIHNVTCDGYMTPLDEEPIDCSNTIDDRDLLECYENNSFLCPSCTDQVNDFHAHRENWFRRNP